MRRACAQIESRVKGANKSLKYPWMTEAHEMPMGSVMRSSNAQRLALTPTQQFTDCVSAERPMNRRQIGSRLENLNLKHCIVSQLGREEGRGGGERRGEEGSEREERGGGGEERDGGGESR